MFKKQQHVSDLDGVVFEAAVAAEEVWQCSTCRSHFVGPVSFFEESDPSIGANSPTRLCHGCFESDFDN